MSFLNAVIVQDVVRCVMSKIEEAEEAYANIKRHAEKDAIFCDLFHGALFRFQHGYCATQRTTFCVARSQLFVYSANINLARERKNDDRASLDYIPT